MEHQKVNIERRSLGTSLKQISIEAFDALCESARDFDPSSASKPAPLESQLIDLSIAVVGQLMPMLGQISMPLNTHSSKGLRYNFLLRL